MGVQRWYPTSRNPRSADSRRYTTGDAHARGEMVRLYRKRFGAGGRLRMTRIALANLHARNEALVRAILEFRRLLPEQPARHDIPLGLAETLWRRGDASEAEPLCREILADR